MKLLVVCLGNICRSPLAEGALRERIARSPLAGRIQVDSAGTGDWHAGQPPDPRAIACARNHGVDISDLRARQLRRSDFDYFDWLLCADRQNLRDVLAQAPAHSRGKVGLLLE
ncbi:MAG: low molecular weight phosphotyrosine protein phosphatase, partial [Lysobacteraceae bacterium]